MALLEPRLADVAASVFEVPEAGWRRNLGADR